MIKPPQKKFIFLACLLAIALVFLSFQFIRNTSAFTGPGSSPGSGFGIIQIDTNPPNRNLNFGTSTLTIGNATFSDAYPFRVVSPTGTAYMVVNAASGAMSIATSSPPPGAASGASTNKVLFVDGMAIIRSIKANDITANNVLSGVTAPFVSPGTFGCQDPVLDPTCASYSGNYAFPFQLGVGATSTVNLSGQQLSVYGGGYFSGKVGIGVTSPLSALDVRSDRLVSFPTPGASAYGSIHIVPTSNTNGNSAGVTFGANDELASIKTGSQAGIYVQSSGLYGTKMYFATTNSYGTGAQARMMIDHLGNVGIGTTGPSYKLHVNGTFGAATSTFTGQIQTAAAGIRFSDGTVQTTYANPGTGFANYIARWDPNDNTKLTSSTIYQKSNGFIGIGTTDPSYQLEVAGTLGVSGFGNFYGLVVAGPVVSANGLVLSDDAGYKSIQSYNTEPLSINPVGNNVGIGTTAPGAKLDVAGDFRTTSSTVSGYLYVGNNLLVSGNAGIGLTSLANNFDVEGRVAIGASYAGNVVAPSNGLIVEGNVGIGNSSPASKLHVTGYFQFTQTSAGAPLSTDCDGDTKRGRLSIDTTNNRLYVCNGATRGWDYVALTN